MRLPVVWRPEAVAELREAKARYVGIRPELGERFAEAVNEAVENRLLHHFNLLCWKTGAPYWGASVSPTGYISSWKKPALW